MFHGIGFHPDERHIIMTTQKLGWHNLNPEFFAYGSLPFYLLRGLAGLLGLLWDGALDYWWLFVIGRTLSVFIFLLTALGTHRLALALGCSRPASLTAMALLSFNVFHVQLSHFFTVDPLLTLTSIFTLIAIVRIIQNGKRSNYILAGLAFGLSFGTKIASLSLLLPLLIATLWDFAYRRRWRNLDIEFNLLCFVVTAATICFVVQPYSFLDFAAFYRDTRTQIDMVAGRWTPPYTIQYHGTKPYLYPLTQLVDFTIGLPVLIAAAFGLILVLLRPTASWVAVIAWGIASFLIISGSYVKFPRYLLPIYPVIVILAGLALDELRCRVSRSRSTPQSAKVMLSALPVSLVVGHALILSVSLTSLYFHEHSWFRASRWIYANVPGHSHLLSASWDDSLPIDIPGNSPGQYQSTELGFYEPDTLEKVETIATKMARGDYLIFATPRIPASITLDPIKFPHTAPALAALFNGKLGFKLERTFRNYPRLGSWIWRDDVTDESLSVYDHPKSYIFKNVEHLTPLELKERILQAKELPNLPSTTDLLSITESDTMPPLFPGGIALIKWFLAIEVISFLWLPLSLAIFSGSRSTATYIARPLSLFILTALVWGMGMLLPVTIEPTLILGVIGVIALMQASTLVKISPDIKKDYWSASILWWSVVGVFLIHRAWNPEINWGEKPMDFTFYNYFTRLDHLPPEDPWAAGKPMNYYYLSYFLFGLLTKISGVATAYGFNFALASVIGMEVLALTGLLLLLQVPRRTAAIGALLLVSLPNLEAVELVLAYTRSWNFDLFWSTTRLFTSPAFSEYPLWSYLFGDLHAHVVARPLFTLVLIHCAALLLTTVQHSRPVALYTSLGLHLGLLFTLNAWDFITAAPLVCATIAIRMITSGAAILRLSSSMSYTTESEGSFAKRVLKAAVQAVGREYCNLLPIILGPIIIIIFQQHAGDSVPINIGWIRAEEQNTGGMLLRMFGQFLIPLAFSSLLILTMRGYSPGLLNALRGAIILSAPLALIGLCYLLGVPAWIGGHPQTPLFVPFGVSLVAVILTVISGSFVLSPRIELRFVALLSALSGYILLSADTVFLIDRMNTVFKFYQPIWTFLGVSTVVTFSLVISRLRPGFKVFIIRASKIVFIPFLLTSLVLAGITIATVRVNGPRPTLDGGAYLERLDPADYQLVDWLNENTQGTPYILEAHGDGYREFTRITMMTGLPTLLGWSHHVGQRGTSHTEIQRRQQDIRHIYTTPVALEAFNLLRKYRIRYVVLGPRERSVYLADTAKVFAAAPNFFSEVFRSGSTMLYKVNY